MSNRFKLITGGTGEEIYEFDTGAEKADIDRAFAEAWESVQDETGAVSAARLGRLRAFQMAKSRAPMKQDVEAYLRARQAKMQAKYAQLANSIRTPIWNTETSFSFRQLGYGVTIGPLSLDAPRSTPGIIIGYSGLSRTMRSIGLIQSTYRSLPLVDTVNQNPAYSTFGGPITQNWVPLSWLQNEFDRNCNTTCFPKFLGGRIWYPTALLYTTLVQVAQVGDDAVPFQDHSLAVMVATAFECEPKGFRTVVTADALAGIRQLRAQFGSLF